MPDAPLPRGWQREDEFQPFQAQVLAAMDRQATALLTHYPNVTVPDSGIRMLGCHHAPFTSGALLTLWRDLPEWFTGACTGCGDPLRGYLVGGLLSSGGVIGRCLGCDSRLLRHTRSGASAVALLPEEIRNTTIARAEMSARPSETFEHDSLTIGQVSFIRPGEWTPDDASRLLAAKRRAWQPLLAVLGELGETIRREE